MSDNRDYYKILVIAASGKGKTYSFRNMNPETTGFINVENKPLPFKNKFKHHRRVNNYTEVYKTLSDFSVNPEINAIVVDSFSAFLDMVLKVARETKKNFDIWNMYNEEIGKFLTYMKMVNKEVFVTGHYEILGIEGAMEKRLKVKGKEWEGMIEKEFTMVLYGDNAFTEKGPTYHFNVVQENTSAKCPPEIFGSGIFRIDNDSNEVLKSILQFVN